MNRLVLVDTSAWVAFFRNSDARVANIIDCLLEERCVATTGVVRAELLQGAKSRSEFRSLDSMLAAVSLLKEPADVWEQVALLGFRLQRKGFDGIGVPDPASPL